MQRDVAIFTPSAPIYAMPDEILSYIFSFCLEEESEREVWIAMWRYPLSPMTKVPFVVAAVCRRWRIVAVDTRMLWSVLHLGLTFKGSERSAAWTSPEHLSLCMERTRGAPLDLRIFGSHPHDAYYTPSESIVRQSQAFIETNLGALLKRTKRLSVLLGNDEFSTRVLNAIRATPSSSINELRLHSGFSDVPRCPKDGLDGLYPNLRSITLVGIPDALPSNILKNLRRLQLEGMSAYKVCTDELLTALRACPQLEHFHLSEMEMDGWIRGGPFFARSADYRAYQKECRVVPVDIRDRREVEMDEDGEDEHQEHESERQELPARLGDGEYDRVNVIDPPTAILLPHLTTLYVRMVPLRWMQVLCSKLETPNLKHLTIGQHFFDDEDPMWVPSAISAVKDLNLEKIESLSWESEEIQDGTDEEHVAWLLSRLPSVQRLNIQERRIATMFLNVLAVHTPPVLCPHLKTLQLKPCSELPAFVELRRNTASCTPVTQIIMSKYYTEVDALKYEQLGAPITFV